MMRAMPCGKCNDPLASSDFLGFGLTAGWRKSPISPLGGNQKKNKTAAQRCNIFDFFVAYAAVATRAIVIFVAMQRKWLVFAAAAVIMAAFGCESDVELNAPYASETIVYGLLEPALDTQFVKINRTWLGDGNNLDIAMIRDSSEYATGAFEGRMEMINSNNVVVQTFPINEILLDSKLDDGIFYAPEHKAYYFLTPDGLNDDYQYRLALDFPGKPSVAAITDVIGSSPGAISFPPAGNTSFKLNWASVSGSGTTYFNQTFKWNTLPNARRYEATLRIYLTERVWADLNHTQLVEERPVVLDWFLGRETTNRVTGGEVMTVSVNGQAFYRFLESRLTVDPFVTREFGIWAEGPQFARAFDFLLSIANDEFNTYLDVNEPVTNIVQERPQYTNVSNGLGIWASRSTDRVLGVGISDGSIVALVEGPFTANLNFCYANPFSPYACD